MTTARMPPSLCPSCGAMLDATTPTDGRGEWRPEAGDIGVCLKCVTPLVFEGGRVERLSDAAIAALPAYARLELRAAQAKVKAYHEFCGAADKLQEHGRA